MELKDQISEAKKRLAALESNKERRVKALHDGIIVNPHINDDNVVNYCESIGGADIAISETKKFIAAKEAELNAQE